MVRIFIPLEDGSSREIEVNTERSIGRHPSNDIVLTEPSVSSRHATIAPTATGAMVRDLGSTNGSYVNGTRVGETAELHPGDELRLGNLVIRVEGESASEPAHAPPPSADDTQIAAAPVPPANPEPEPAVPWRIVVRAGNDLGSEAPIPDEGELLVGRDSSCDLVLTDPRVSGRHASLRLTPGGLEVTDLDSANGTLVRRTRLSGATVVQPGEEIQVGETVLVPYAGEEAAGYGPIPTIVELTPGAATFDSSQLEALVSRKTRSNRMLIGLVAIFAVAAIGISAALLLGGGGGGNGESSEAAVVERNGPATVQILNLTDGGLQFSGTGSVIDRDEGLILTNNHVASGGELLVVANQATEAVEAELVAAAICDDLALVRIVNSRDRDDFEEVSMGPGTGLRQGDRVIALGYPGSAESAGGNRLDSLSATSGIVSKVDAVYDNPGSGLPLLENVIQHDAAVNPGNSGGPLFDSRGRQVGVNTAIFFGSRGRVEGANYAVSIQRVRELLDDMKDGVSPAWFGASFEEGYDGAGDPVGLLVLGVTPGSVAEDLGFEGATNGEAGIEYRQLITEVNGTPVRNLSEYCDAMPRDREEVVLTVVSGSDSTGVPVQVEVGRR